MARRKNTRRNPIENIFSGFTDSQLETIKKKQSAETAYAKWVMNEGKKGDVDIELAKKMYEHFKSGGLI